MSRALSLVNVLTITLITSSSQAGLFDVFEKYYGPVPSYVATPEWVEFAKKKFPKEVPVKAECAPLFVDGDDGIFRRTEYCHKTNPVQPKGFLEHGYDVPATFLSGFTAVHTGYRLLGARFPRLPVEVSSVEAPDEILAGLNLMAARTWEKILACAKGDADRARELYRIGRFDCEEAPAILSSIAELHQSLRTLSASSAVEPVFEEKRLLERIRDNLHGQQSLKDNAAKDDSFTLDRKQETLDRQLVDIFHLWQKDAPPRNVDLIELLEKTPQRMPHSHPLFVQILLEETLSLVSPTDSPYWAARRLKKDLAVQGSLIQLLFWVQSIEDGSCSALGLWPSANRVALEALGDKVAEIWNQLDAPKRKSIRPLDVVACTFGREKRIGVKTIGHTAIEPQDLDVSILRLSDVYMEGHGAIWQELREVRDRYVGPAK